jgi:paraquat-inducible protein B
MACSPTNHWKLGLFVVLGVIGLIATMVFLGARSVQKETVSYRTYFDESVQGLEVGAPVKFRGVTIGSVKAIEIAPDRRLVEVQMNLAIEDLMRLGLGHKEGRKVKLGVPADLRAQLGSQGITGVKFVQIDFFDPKNNPAPKLPFDPPEDYIPAAVSTLKNIEDAVVQAVHKFPELADQINTLLKRIDGVVAEVDEAKIPAQLGLTLRQANAALASFDKAVKDAKVDKVSDEAQKTIAKLSRLLDDVQAKDGVLASAKRTSDALGDVTRTSLDQTLREIREAAEAIRRLADALERDPDMLLKGRQKK